MSRFLISPILLAITLGACAEPMMKPNDNWVAIGYPDGPYYEVSNGPTTISGTYGCDVSWVKVKIVYQRTENGLTSEETYSNVTMDDGAWSYDYDFYGMDWYYAVGIFVTCGDGLQNGDGDNVWVSVVR